MQFQIKQRVFSLGDTYDITDAEGQPVYQVQGKAFSFGNQLDLMDMQGGPVAHIQQKVFSMSTEYDISRNGAVALVFRQDGWHPFHPQYAVDGPGGSYTMQGDWQSWEYTISGADGQQVAQISKQWTWGNDTYGMQIADGADVPALLCLAIVMDEVAHPDNQD